MGKVTSVYTQIQVSILSGSGGKLPSFYLPTPGIKLRLPAWVESSYPVTQEAIYKTVSSRTM